VLVLGGDVAEDRFAHGVQLAIGVEEPHEALRLLKGLNQAVQEDPIEAPVRETDAIVWLCPVITRVSRVTGLSRASP
jgi:hypothetical protein